MKKKYYYNVSIGLIFWLYTFIAFAQPVNNDCTNATLITVGVTCQTVYNNVDATNVGNSGDIGCGDINTGIWFRFIATKSLQRIYLSNYTPVFDATIRVYSGTCGGTLTSLLCINTGGNGINETGDITGLTPGTTYYIRVTSVTNANRGNFCLQVFDPTPPNDDCVNAIPLTINDLCTNGSINSATANAPNGGGTCGNASRTVWYSFVATSTTHQIYLKNEGGFNVAYAVYSGGCGTLNQIACRNIAGGDEFQTHLGLFVVNQTYLIRVNGNTATDAGNFCIRVFATPSNDLCNNAISIPTNGTCVEGYTNAASTDGINLPSPACVNTNGGPTVWYSFTATATNHTVVLDIDNLDGSNNEDLGFSVYTGTCEALTLINCENSFFSDQDEREVLSSLTIGQTYLIRVTGRNATDQGTFCIKVTSPPPNDDCANARNLTPNGNCVAGYNYNNINVELTPGDCINNTNMVWYSFVATSTVHTVQLTNVSTWANLGFRVFQATGTCNGFAIACRDAVGSGASEVLTLTTLTVGTLYYVVVGGNTASDQGEFCIRIEAPPFNDLCENARELVINNPCFAANNIGSTNDGTNPTSTCANTDHTVWFKFRATATSHIVSLDNRETTFTGTENLAMTVYSTSDNTCSGTFSQVSCIDDTFNSQGETRVLTGLTVGQMYYVMVSGDETIDEAQFCISVTNNNDLCANAVPIVANSECIAGGNRGTTTTGGTDGNCQSPNKTVWYSYTPNYSNAILTVDPSSELRAEVTVFSATGTCIGLNRIACQDNGGVGATETVSLNSLIPGNLYYIMVDGQANGSQSEGTFCISIKEPLACGPNPLPANTCDAAPLINSLDGYCGFTNFEYTPNTYNNLTSISPAFCNGGADIENNSFLRFTADAQEVFLELNIVTSSPNGGPPCDSGIQLEVYSVSGNDCTTGVWNPLLPQCISPSGGVGSTVQVRLSNLVPGNVYYIMFDGAGGDECGFVIRAPFGGGVLLPLDLLEFNAEPLEYANKVEWKVVQNYTLGERFWVERSTNQMQFETLGELFHQNGKTAYQFLDETATEKRDYYYRLRTIDNEGKYHFSKTILISENDEPKTNEKSFVIYPNPTSKELNISLRAEQNTTVSIQILDTQGKMIKEVSSRASKGMNKFVVPTQNLQRGLYIIRMIDNLGTISYQEKFVKE